MREYLEHIDTSLFLLLNGKHNPFWDVVMYWTTWKFTWIPLYLLLLVLAWNKKGKAVWLVLVAAGVLIVLSDQLSVNAFKEVFERYRPCHNQLLKDQVHLIDGCGGMYGFVSSHAANTFAIAVFIGMVLGTRRALWLLLLWAMFVSYSRIYGGVHYPADIISGALLGSFLAWLVYRLYSIAEMRFIKKNVF